MKLFLILFTSFTISTLTANAHDKITFKNKESFNQSCETGKTCTTFDLIKEIEKSELTNVGQWIKDNSSLFQYKVEGTIIHLQVLNPSPEKTIFEKMFHLMGLNEIEILEGDSKGVYSVDEFLSLYQF